MSREPLIGLHVSISESIDLAFDRALAVGANTFQIFTRNPSQWKFKPIPKEQVSAFKEKRHSTGMAKVVAHMPYLPNLASSDPGTMKLSRASLDAEVERCDELGIDYLVTHLGSHLGAGSAVGIRNVAGACNQALKGGTGDVTILLENTAGQKNTVGSRFEDLKSIIAMVKEVEQIGVCFDSCHAFASGFDLRSQEAVRGTMELFDEIVGYERLKVVHLNDSKGPLGSNLDRHENVGRGKIGRAGLRAVLKYPGLIERPVIMETPYEDAQGMIESVETVHGLLR